MCKNAVKKLPLVIIHVPDWYMTQEMCSKVILGNGGMLKFIPDCYKNWKTCDKAADNYSHALKLDRGCYKTQKIWHKAVGTYLSAIQFVSEFYKTQETCDKAAGTFPFVFDSVLDQCKSQKMCLREIVVRVVCKGPFMLKYCLDRYNAQETCDEALDACLLALELVPDWFVTNKMLEKPEIFSKDEIDLDDIYSNIYIIFFGVTSTLG